MNSSEYTKHVTFDGQIEYRATPKAEMSTRLANPIQIQVFESNDSSDMGEMMEFHTLSALAEWAAYEVSCYVASRATVQLALDKFSMDIISGKYQFRTFQIECMPYSGYEGPRIWTRYILQSIGREAVSLNGF